MTDYKTYQKVLSIGVKQSNKPKVTKPKVQCANIKRRTKTGCLTCRKRKKKCDEDKVNGKCQGCTRNFLECCWQEDKIQITKPITPEPSPMGSPIATKTEVHKPTSGKFTIESMLATPIDNPYPSPVQSPCTEVKSEIKDVQYFALPPSRGFEENKREATTKPEQVKSQAKFIITSFNGDKDLCQV